MTFRGIVLLDRDGTINVERCYLATPEEVELLPGAAEGICRMHALGLAVAVVTNQSAIGRGMFDEDRLESIHQRLRDLLGREGAALDAIYACPHHPDTGCACRKPAPGMARRATEEFRNGTSPVFVIGDKPCDIELGKNIDAVTILVKTGYGAEYAEAPDLGADYIVEDLREAAAVIGRQLDGRTQPAPDRSDS